MKIEGGGGPESRGCETGNYRNQTKKLKRLNNSSKALGEDCNRNTPIGKQSTTNKAQEKAK